MKKGKFNKDNGDSAQSLFYDDDEFEEPEIEELIPQRDDEIDISADRIPGESGVG